MLRWRYNYLLMTTKSIAIWLQRSDTSSADAVETGLARIQTQFGDLVAYRRLAVPRAASPTSAYALGAAGAALKLGGRRQESERQSRGFGVLRPFEAVEENHHDATNHPKGGRPG